MSTSINRENRIFSLREAEKIHDAAFLAGRIAQAKEDAVIVASVKTVFMAGYPDTTATLNCAADSILANAAKLAASAQEQEDK